MVSLNSVFFLLLLLSITTQVYSLQYHDHTHNYSCVQQDQSSLLHLKQSLQYDSDFPSKLSTWNSSSDCCVWGGVTCSATSGHVIGLDLYYQGITGWGLFHNSSSSSPLFDLHHLQRLDLSYNSFNGTPIPSGIGKLANLLHLDLSYSGFGGQVPVEISTLLTTLLTLNLSRNPDLKLENPKLSTLVHNLTRLTELNLDMVDLSAEGDQWSHALSSSLPNLQVLSLSNCSLYGNFPHKMPASIQTLDLSRNQLLSGTLPEAIGNLKMVTNLYLDSCGFSGSIANIHWESLGNLNYLSLGGNALNGTIPSSLFSHPSLMGLSLSDNQFSGDFPIVSSSNSILVYLDLGSNNLEGTIPTSIFKLVGLRSLYIYNNNFSGSIDLTYLLRNLVNLSYIDLSFNSLSIVDNVASASTINSSFPDQLWLVRLASCNLKAFPDFLRNQSMLLFLDLSDNQIDGQIPNWIWNPNLFHVNLSHNSLLGFQGSFSNFTSIRILDLSSNRLRGENLLDFENYLSVTVFLSLKNNNLHGSIPPSFCNNSNNLIEAVVDFSNNSLSGIIPRCLIAMNVGVLNLRGNNLTGDIPDAFLPNCSLQTLDLSDNHLQGNVPQSMVHCKSLQVLNLGNNEINGGFPCWLMEISSLRVLVLRSNRFHGSISCAFGNATAATTDSWSMLQIIDIATNNFDGELPSESFKSWKAMTAQRDSAQPKLDHLGYRGYYQDSVTITSKGNFMELVKILTVFDSIDFSCNHFQGSIPTSIGDLRSIYALNLSHNNFTGQIPSSVGKLKVMESLDLANNSLSGGIPEELASLNFLSFLNLSYNQLVGRIPTSTQLQSFSEMSYTGNKGLSGPPLDINCTSTGLAPIDPDSSKVGNKEIDWEIICAEIGYAVGLGTVVASLIFWKRWRLWYFARVDRLLFRIFPRLNPGTTTIRGRRRRQRQRQRH